MSVPAASATDAWPNLPLEAWSDTCTTLHRWFQIVGKVRLAQTPWMNHSRHVTLYVTARGLTTSPVRYGTRTFQIDFDFINHELIVETNDGVRSDLDCSTLRIGRGNVLYCDVDRGERGVMSARFLRAAYYDLARWIVEDGGGPALRCKGTQHRLVPPP